MIASAAGAALVGLTYWAYRHPVWGGKHTPTDKARFYTSKHYEKGSFKNLEHTPDFTEGYTYGKVMREFLFERGPNLKPPVPVSYTHTDLHQLPEQSLVWMGHSSYLLQWQGKRILVDPVLSGSASPIPGMIGAFKGSNGHTAADLPPIDLLVITHDHYDHLDYRTVKQLVGRVGEVVCGLGVGAHLRRWGFSPERITELDWWEESTDLAGFKATAVPTRHFSGRLLNRNNTLWMGLVLEAGGKKVLLGGDSGYGKHFADIGRRLGPFDLVIIENGQYDHKWHYIHLHPEEAAVAAEELGAKKLLPVHSGKFALANHAWDEPRKRLAAASAGKNYELLLPGLGEAISWA
jgi:L-ascorbate metabolism protein UlaG (beta-lactamase superfamily)